VTETGAQKRERILGSELDHAEPPPATEFATAVTVAQFGTQAIDAPFITLLAHPSKWFQPRGQTPTSVVIHCNGTGFPATNTAAFFHSSAEGGSAQAVADGEQGFTCVPDDAICAGAPPLNQEGLHIEQPGRTDWSRATWLAHDAQLRRVAHHVRGWCDKYSIPLVLLDAGDLGRQGENARGITYHAAVSEAFHQSTHTDPMPNYPWDVFMGYVQGGDEMTPEEKAQLNEALSKAREADEFKNGVNLRRTGKPEPAEGPARNGWRFADEAFSRPGSNGGGSTAPTKPFTALITPKA
jgi:hypothetical protein